MAETKINQNQIGGNKTGTGPLVFGTNNTQTVQVTDNTTQSLVTVTTTGTTTFDLSLGQTVAIQVNGSGQTFTIAVSNEPTNSYQADGYLDFVAGTIALSGLTQMTDSATPEAGNKYAFTLYKNTSQPSAKTYISFTQLE